MTEVRYQRRPDVMFTTVSGEVLALDVLHGHCFGMNSVASEVWNLLAEPRSEEQVCAALVEQFDVAPAECRTATAAILGQLQNDGLVEVQPVN